MKICEEFYINGEWVKPINELKTLDVINPATEEVFGRIALGDMEGAAQAFRSALHFNPNNTAAKDNLIQVERELSRLSTEKQENP